MGGLRMRACRSAMYSLSKVSRDRPLATLEVMLEPAMAPAPTAPATMDTVPLPAHHKQIAHSPYSRFPLSWLRVPFHSWMCGL